MPVPRLRYSTYEFGDTDIHICSLRDRQQFYDPDGVAEDLGIGDAAWPIFGVVWPSSIVLAHYINELDTDKVRILEIGCGMALTSLLLNKADSDITATDRHPDAEHFLLRNSKLNDDTPITFKRADWADQSDELGRFDMIIGSDLLYEDEHVDLLAIFIERHANPACKIIIVDPGRGRKTKFCKKMQTLGFDTSEEKAETSEYIKEEYNGFILKCER